MASQGFIQGSAIISRAQLPLEGVAVTVSNSSGLLGYRMTDESGIFSPIAVTVPDRADSLTPDTSVRPYATVTLRAVHPGFERIEVDNLQVFSGVTTDQTLVMIPLPELPEDLAKTEVFQTPPQNL